MNERKNDRPGSVEIYNKTAIRKATSEVPAEECKEIRAVVTRENSSTDNSEFSNPFINFDIKRFLESTRTIKEDVNLKVAQEVN